MNKMIDVQYMKVVALLLVIYGHVINRFTCYSSDNVVVPIYDVILKFISMFHTQTFTYCAGFLFGFYILKGQYLDFICFIKKKIQRLILPIFLFGTLLCLFSGIELRSLLYSATYLWYLLMLFECFVIIWFYHNFLSSKFHDNLGILLNLVCLLFIPRLTNFLSIDGLISQFPFFFIGYIVSKKQIFKKILYNSFLLNVSNGIFIVSFISLLFFSIASVFYYDSTICGLFNFFEKCYWHLPFFSLFFIISTQTILRKHINSLKTYTVIDKLSSYSFRMYILHPFIILLLDSIIENYVRIYIYTSFLVYMLVLLLSYCLSTVVSRTPLNKIM